MENDYQRHMMTVVDELRRQGVHSLTAAPPLYRLAWRLGLRIAPPLYQSFTTRAVIQGVEFAAIWGLLMWLLLWRSEGRSIVAVLTDSAFAGLFFGLTMAAYFRRKARGLHLPPLDAPPGLARGGEA